MSEEDLLRKIEARLTRLEATLSQQPTANMPHPGAVVDPLPWPGWGGGGWGAGGPWHPGRPHPIVDSAAYAPQFQQQQYQYRYHPPYIVDPVPWPYFDPSAYAAAAQQPNVASSFRRPGPIMDPPPIDVSRFTIEQLEAALHSINAEKARLHSVETMITQQLEKRQREE